MDPQSPVPMRGTVHRAVFTDTAHSDARPLTLLVYGGGLAAKSQGPTLLCDPTDYNLPGSLSVGVSRASILEWVAIFHFGTEEGIKSQLCSIDSEPVVEFALKKWTHSMSRHPGFRASYRTGGLTMSWATLVNSKNAGRAPHSQGHPVWLGRMAPH